MRGNGKLEIDKFGIKLVKNKDSIPICHLCGREIKSGLSNEHVPPKQFFLSRVRKNENLNLITLPTHKKCNQKYQKDEEYFFSLIGTMAAIESRFGSEIFYDLNKKFNRSQGRELLKRIRSQFEKRPSGIILPKDKIALRYEKGRINKVIWKILKGLYYVEYKQYLPDNISKKIELIQPGEKPPDHFLLLLSNKRKRGKYNGIFDYKYMKIVGEAELSDKILHYWAFLIWDRVIFTIMFHDTDCSCENCSINKTNPVK